jgi:integrase
LRWKCVNLGADPILIDGEMLPGYTIAVRENFVRGNYGTLKTRTSRRNVPLNTDASREFAKIRAASKFTGPDQPVFAGQRAGQPLDQHNIASRFLRIAGKRKEVGCPWVSWHVLRHTAATLADQVGLSVSERQRVLGHAAGAMTLHYTHAELDRVREGMEKIGKGRVQ